MRVHIMSWSVFDTQFNTSLIFLIPTTHLLSIGAELSLARKMLVPLPHGNKVKMARPSLLRLSLASTIIA